MDMAFDLNFQIAPNVNLCSSHTELLKLVRKVVCYNQGMLAEYGFLASEKHKKLKDYLHTENRDKEQVIALTNDLELFTNGQLMNVAIENFKYAKAYFKGRSRRNVRVCIKIPDDNEAIVPLFRDTEYMPNKEYPLDANTGFSDIARNTGVHFLQNDIPAAVKNQEYKNARIRLQSALTYQASNWLKRWLSKEPDKAWIDCWERIEGPGGELITPPTEACYKSTLIVPMTLKNNQLTPEFKENFGIDGDRKSVV